MKENQMTSSQNGKDSPLMRYHIPKAQIPVSRMSPWPKASHNPLQLLKTTANATGDPPLVVGKALPTWRTIRMRTTGMEKGNWCSSRSFIHTG